MITEDNAYSYIVFGSDIFGGPNDTGVTADLPVELTNGEAMLWGTSDTQDLSGWDFAGISDVNNDGYDDFAIAAPAASLEATHQGAVHLVMGDPSHAPALQTEHNLETAGYPLTLSEEGAALGAIVEPIDDLNADGAAELLMVAHYADQNLPNMTAPTANTQAYIVDLTQVSGATGTTHDVNNMAHLVLDFEQTVSNEDVVYSTSANALDPYGPALSFSSGDTNGDGVPEILAGFATQDAPTGESLAGQVYAFEWDSSTTNLTLADASTQYYLDQEDGLLGTDVLVGPDINEDGYADTFMASAGAQTELNKSGTRNTGAVFAFSGSATTTSGSVDIYNYDFQVFGGMNSYRDYDLTNVAYTFASGETDDLVVGVSSLGGNDGSTWVIPATPGGYSGSSKITYVYETHFANEYNHNTAYSPTIGNLDGNALPDILFGAAHENSLTSSTTTDPYLESGAIYVAFDY